MRFLTHFNAVNVFFLNVRALQRTCFRHKRAELQCVPCCSIPDMFSLRQQNVQASKMLCGCWLLGFSLWRAAISAVRWCDRPSISTRLQLMPLNDVICASSGDDQRRCLDGRVSSCQRCALASWHFWSAAGVHFPVWQIILYCCLVNNENYDF